MNTAQIKAYAPKARTDFIKAVTERAARFGIHSDTLIDPIEFKGDLAIIGSQPFSRKGGELREKLVGRVKQSGFEMFIRSHAYTWFNRFVAIRYMELHNFLGHGFRVLSNPNGSDIPEILEHAVDVDLPGLDRQKVIELRLAGDKDNELYRMLIIDQCNALHNAMPFLFEKIDNEAELLLPDNLLHSNSPIRKMVQDIDEDLWKDVEIIGWIYQFYISEKKDEVIGKIVKSEDIPAATQLFTPNWIVKYMVQNTLGRMWMATYPHSSLKESMEYYIEPAEQDSEVQKEMDAATPRELNPEKITFLDPACGSGHILVEAYDIFKAIYLERGYRTRDIPCLILEKNLYGLDIDDRAAQLACFAVLMKARKDDRQLFSRDGLTLNIMSIVETKGFDKNKLLEAVSKRDGGKGVWVWIHELVELFEHAKTFGSLITIPDELAKKIDDIKSVIESDRIGNDDIFNYIAGAELQGLRPIVRLSQLLAKKYDCVVANPPFMSIRVMNSRLKIFAREFYPFSNSDLFSMFGEKILKMVQYNKFVGLMTPFTWMFLNSFEKFRKDILINNTINSLIKPSYTAFFQSAIVPICSFIIHRYHNENYIGNFIDLGYLGNADEQPKRLFEVLKNSKSDKLYRAATKDFLEISGSPIAYWVTEKVRNIFAKSLPLNTFASPRQGLATSDNNRFLRLWFEINIEKAGFNLESSEEVKIKKKKWIPYNKGGEFRKWFGNNNFLINWENDGEEVIQYAASLYGSPTRTIKNQSFYFKKCATWSFVSSSFFGVRYSDKGFIFDVGGSSAFCDEDQLYLLTGFLCSNLVFELMKVFNPTLNFQSGNVAALPWQKKVLFEKKALIDSVVKKCIQISRDDWNNFETSWEFMIFPLLSKDIIASTVKRSFLNWQIHCHSQIKKMQDLERENNSLFIEAYNLQDEVPSEVSEKMITLVREDRTVDIKRLLSYAIGCMMGRYSLDHPGLIYAHSGNIDFDSSKYKIFPADDDGIIPVMDMDWFEDDATSRFVEFIKTAWPPETLDENLKFIADSLSPKAGESSEETIRRYLSAAFFKDHMQTYKKRPIYWLFSSGRQKAFECLVYLHRYNDATLSRMRSNYVTPLQGNISARIEFLEHEKDAATTASSQKKIQKEIDILKKKQLELKAFDDQLRHYADMKISIDLDDGVKVNCGKFGGLVAFSC